MRARELRKKSRRNQAEIAAVLGIAPGTYSEKEREDGRIRFSLEEAVALRNFYNNLPEMRGIVNVKVEDFIKEPAHNA